MQIIFHTGVHCTDDERLLKCLLRNKEMLADQGVAVPGPGTYRQILADTFAALKSSDPTPEARDVLLDAMLDEEIADRLIMSDQHFYGPQRTAVAGSQFYPGAPLRAAQMSKLFSYDQVEIFLAIRNPATFLPALTKIMRPRPAQKMVETAEPESLRWSELIGRIRRAAPDVSLTIWCNEDLPLIWGQVMRETAGLDFSAPIEGEFDLLGEIMTDEGQRRFLAYIAQHPEMNEMQLRRVIVAFLDKFANEDAVEEELDLPGWTETLVDNLTDAYDEDLYRIERIPGVNLITP